jgi:hypothetical protein
MSFLVPHKADCMESVSNYFSRTGATAMRRDMEMMHAMHEELVSAVPAWDDARILATMSVSHASVSRARASILRLFKQATASRYSIDMILGMNDGTDASAIIRDVQTADVAMVEEGFSSISTQSADGADVVQQSPLSDGELCLQDCPESQNRMVVIHQSHEPGAAGKNRMLKTIMDFITANIRNHTYVHPPRLLLDCDDDVHLSVAGHDGANALQMLVDEAGSRNVAALSCRMTSVPFVSQGELSVPDSAAVPDPAYAFIDENQNARKPFLSGNASIGETPLMIAARKPIVMNYRGSLADDLHRTLYVHVAGAPWGVSDNVEGTNERRSNDDQQLERWVRGIVSLQKHFGHRVLMMLQRMPNTAYMPAKLWDVVARVVQEREKLSLTGQAHW